MTQSFNRFDPAKNYESHRFIPNRPLQSAELNEIQTRAAYTLKGVADTLLKDGAVIRDAGIVVHPETGVTTCEAGAVYLRGVVRGVAPATRLAAQPRRRRAAGGLADVAAPRRGNAAGSPTMAA